MGMYDTVLAACPKCGTRNEFQTKSGPCRLGVFNLEVAPVDVLLGVNRHAPQTCGQCQTPYHVHLTVVARPEFWPPSRPDPGDEGG